MKPDPVTVLMYGKDESLLETRQWVLQSRGYKVLWLTRLSGLRAIPSVPAVKLLLLCHTLSPSECADAINLTSRRWPGLRHLVLRAETARNPTGLLGQLLHTMDGPGKLLTLVGEMIGTDVAPRPAAGSLPEPS